MNSMIKNHINRKKKHKKQTQTHKNTNTQKHKNTNTQKHKKTKTQKHMVTMVMLRKMTRMIKMSKVEDRCESWPGTNALDEARLPFLVQLSATGELKSWASNIAKKHRLEENPRCWKKHWLEKNTEWKRKNIDWKKTEWRKNRGAERSVSWPKELIKLVGDKQASYLSFFLHTEFSPHKFRIKKA